jgi:hypothetical protein
MKYQCKKIFESLVIGIFFGVVVCCLLFFVMCGINLIDFLAKSYGDFVAVSCVVIFISTVFVGSIVYFNLDE